MLKRNLLGAALAFALAAPAQAGSLAIVGTSGSNTCPAVTPPSGGASITRCITGPDAQFARVIAAYKAIHGLPANATTAQVFTALAASIMDGIKANVLSHERAAARTTAEDGVAPVDMQ
jgi:hypothetical protein